MNLNAVIQHEFEAKVAHFSDRDTMLYALSLGAGHGHTKDELRFVYEKELVSLPSMAAVLAHPGAWMSEKKFDVDMVKLLHGEQRCDIHKPLPASGNIRAEYHVPAIVDKGADKGALMYFGKEIYDHNTNEHLCSVLSTYFLQGDGGCGDYGEAPAKLAAVPDRAPDITVEEAVDNRAALIYRLNGDRNPIHIDPAIAEKAGFSTPILHGLCIYGVCGLTLIRSALNYCVESVAALHLRFNTPVYPGETLVIEAWKTEGGIAFQATAKERNERVVKDGFLGIYPDH